VEFVSSDGEPHSSFSVPEVGEFVAVDATSLKHGATAVSIVPPWKVALLGYGGIHRRLLPPLLAQVGRSGAYQAVYSSVDYAPQMKIALWEGANTEGKIEPFVLVGIDVVAVSPDFVEALVNKVRLVFNDESLGWQNVIVVASHTHSGPAGLSRDELFQFFAGDTFSEKYLSFVLELFERELRSVRANAESVVSVNSFEAEVEGLNGDRLPSLSRDKRNLLLEFVSASQKNCFNVFGMHPTYHAQKDLVLSADLAGAIEEGLKKESAAGFCAFFPGAVGNASHGASDSEGMKGFGQRFAQTVREKGFAASSLSRVQFGGMPVSVPELQMNWRGCDASWAKYFASLPILARRSRLAWMGWARFNNHAFVFVPGEPLSDFSKHLEQQILAADSTLQTVRTVGVSNGYLGYLMQRGAYDEKSLESCSALVSPDGVESLAQQFVFGLPK
jgi:hypothetical protein